MRDIKFRAWHFQDKEMIQWDETFFSDMSKATNYSNDFVNNDTDIILMQFTGRYDCKKTPIYEGDIIEFDKREWGGNDNIMVVEWDNHNCEWSFGGGSCSDMEWRTVIGNIYENPDLINA